MNLTAILEAAKAHPETLNQLEALVHTECGTDPTFLVEVIQAAESKSWPAFGLAHLAFVGKVITVVAQNADLLKSVSDLLPKSLVN